LLATKLANYHTSGFELAGAAHRAITEFSQSNKTCATVAMDSAGKISISSTARVFYTASASSNRPIQANLQPATHPILRQHIFHHGLQTIAGLSRFPSTKGHTNVVLRSAKDDLFSLDLAEYMRTMIEVREVAGVLRNYYDVARCALAADGSDVLSIVPLHGLKKDWERVNSPKKEFHESFPGYISSMDGPQMDASRLRTICAKIQKASSISATYNYRFDGEQSDQNLFARIVRGELPQSRVWEDEHHVAFLTPFANTPGFTVLVARAHLPSDIFSLELGDYCSLVRSAHSVAQTLKSSLGLRRCGMIFEGLEVDYAHVKLIPIHEKEGVQELSKADSPMTQSAHEEKYTGHVTSQNGPLTNDPESLSIDAMNLHSIQNVQRIEAPRSWETPSNHCMRVLQEPWYNKVLAVQDTVYHATVRLFKNGLGYKYGLLPATMDAISSPMGLGSDSQPVLISLLGQSTHLADSMQFALEYFLRIEKGLPGVYYVGCSFRGEDSDKMHLNQFYHVECELLGDFAKGISVAEQYLFALVSTLVEEQSDSIQAVAGGIAHLKAFLDDCRSKDGRLPQITLDQALKLPEMGGNTWEYAVPSQPEKGRCITRAGEHQLIKYFGGAVWLTEMDHLSVPFYQAFTDETRTKGLCADLLLGNGEVLGLGERHLRPADVSEALREHVVPAEPYTWYVQMKQTK
jgi:beta-aspartyl-peptidase (threonine type)